MNDSIVLPKKCENCRFMVPENGGKCSLDSCEPSEFIRYNMPKTSMVSHPAHYTQGKIEVIDFIEDQKMNYLEGNVIKYICRYKFKNGIQDLGKAKWYLERLIKSMK